MDQTQDLGGQEIYRINSLYNSPEYVKQADHQKLCGNPEELQGKPQMYADPYNKAFPIHTAPATWASAAFYFDKKSSVKPQAQVSIEANLVKAARFFGILPDIQAVEKRAAECNDDGMSKLSDSEFAVVWTPDNGPVERHWPLCNKDQVKAAAENLFKNRDDFRYSDRQKIASKIRERATQKGAALGELEDFIDKQAGLGTCAAKDVVEFLQTRIKAAHGHTAPQNVEQLQKIAETLQTNPHEARREENLRKLAGLVEQFDKDTGINRNYGEILKRPEDVFFNVTIKAAATMLNDHVSMQSGDIYKKADLARVELNQIRDWMGNGLADEVAIGGVAVDHEKLADVAPTLPRPEAELFSRMMADEVGVYPTVKEAAHQAQGLSREELFALAGPDA